MPRPILAPVLILAGLGGCTHPSPSVVLHTLSPLPPEAPASPLPALRVEVLPVRIPEVLQRSQLVLLSAPERMELAEGHRWANGLDQELTARLRENLSLLLGSEGVVAYPDGPKAKATLRVSVEIQRCEATPGRGLFLKATWMILPASGGAALSLRQVEVQEPMKDPGLEALVSAHSRALGSLSRQIADDLRACTR